MKTAALILAAGSSSRMNGINKQFLEIDGVPVIIKSALAFERSPLIGSIIIAARECDVPAIRGLCEKYGITKLGAVTAGGSTRTESAYKAFQLAGGADIVAVHDGARPFADEALIERVINAAEEYGAAVPAVAVKDTIKVMSDGFSAHTPDRSSLRAAQTPQAFRYEIYEKIISPGADATDDAGLAENAGYKVRIVDGNLENIKITTPEDIRMLKGGAPMIRIGHGYDVHRLAENRRLVLGGTEIPCELGLLGHSDADVLLHAVTDAILGALALGDIGKHFPDTDKAYKDIDSRILLRKAAELARERGWRVSNLDATINAEKPKLAKYIVQMRENIAADCGVPADRISVKATTEEGLGLRGEGIGATCVCLLEST